MVTATDQLFTALPWALCLSSLPFLHLMADVTLSLWAAKIVCLQAWNQPSTCVYFSLHHFSRGSASGFPFSAKNEHTAFHLPLNLSVKRIWHNRCFPPRCFLWMAILAGLFFFWTKSCLLLFFPHAELFPFGLTTIIHCSPWNRNCHCPRGRWWLPILWGIIKRRPRWEQWEKPSQRGHQLRLATALGPYRAQPCWGEVVIYWAASGPCLREKHDSMQ